MKWLVLSLFSLSANAVQINCNSDVSDETAYTSKFLVAPCLKSSVEKYLACLDKASEDCSVAHEAELGEKDLKKAGVHGSTVVMSKRSLKAANCHYMRAKCISDEVAAVSSCEFNFQSLMNEYNGHVSSTRACLDNAGSQYEAEARNFLAEENAGMSREIYVTEGVACNTIPGWRNCSFVKGVSANNGPRTSPDRGGALPHVTLPSTRYGSENNLPKAPVQTSCNGTILGDGVTAITDGNCSTTGGPRITLQSVDSSGKPVTLAATCDNQAGTKNDSLKCTLNRPVPSKPIYALEVDNSLPKCTLARTAWAVSCPAPALEAALQKRVKVFGVAGQKLNPKPEDGYVLYDRRTGRISHATDKGVVDNGLVFEVAGKTVVAHSRRPASADPTDMGSSFAIDKFVLQSSRTRLTPEVKAAGAPLMREIELGDR